MKLVRTPNPWSCLASSFASALEIPYDHLIHLVGHDGSEILHPGYEDPRRRRAFHIQEMIDAALSLGWLITPIDAVPTYVINGQIKGSIFKMEKDPALRMLRYLSTGFGVLTGQNMKGNPHAVVWSGSQVHDPTTLVTYGVEHFSIQTFWKMVRAEQFI